MKRPIIKISPPTEEDKLAAAMMETILKENEEQAIKRLMQAQMARKPKNVPKDQEWFWTEEWQRGEAEAQLEIDEGRVYTCHSVKEMLGILHNET